MRAIPPSLNKASRLVLFAPPVTTLAITPWMSYDPINPIKMMVLSLAGSLGLFLFFALKIQKLPMPSLTLFFAIAVFIFSMPLVMLMSDSYSLQQFWGVFGRNNGVLSHLSLSILALLAALVSYSVNLTNDFIKVLTTSTILLALYGILQLLNLDPINWSSDELFGTLGNANFYSAFLGMGLIPISFKVFSSRNPIRIFTFGIIALVILFLILETNSSQGLLSFFAGISLLTIIALRARNYVLSKILSLLWLIGMGFGVLGILNRGFFASVIYQETTAYRYDYWLAGIRAFIDKPFTGLGLDAFGDYYRFYRDEIAVLRTGPERYTNTAHNVFIDIAANGGLVMLVPYLILNVLVVSAAVKAFRKGYLDVQCSILFCVWVSFTLQSLVSIGQLGLSVWGWVISGLLIGSLSAKSKKIAVYESRAFSSGANRLSTPTELLSSIAVLIIGLLISLPPFLADSNFRRALESNNNDQILNASRALGATAWHGDVALESLLAKADASSSLDQSRFLIDRYPRDIYAVRSRMVLYGISEEERRALFELARKLDPLNKSISFPEAP